MPELPEVETTRRGIEPHICGQQIIRVLVRNRQLRWPVPTVLETSLLGVTTQSIERRAKYLLFHTSKGVMIVHLGMSGSLHIAIAGDQMNKHDHLEIEFSNGRLLRLNDPRRFSSLHWTALPVEAHRLIRPLGPEPLDAAFTEDYLYHKSRNRTVAIKNFIMDSHVVAGIGNIYASESLFLSGIHPRRGAGKVSKSRYGKLLTAIRQVLQSAIEAGGSTLNDFVRPDGRPGYFQHHFSVYGRAGQPCRKCGSPIKQITLGQRSTFYCGRCQR